MIIIIVIARCIVTNIWNKCPKQ